VPEAKKAQRIRKRSMKNKGRSPTPSRPQTQKTSTGQIPNKTRQKTKNHETTYQTKQKKSFCELGGQSTKETAPSTAVTSQTRQKQEKGRQKEAGPPADGDPTNSPGHPINLYQGKGHSERKNRRPKLFRPPGGISRFLCVSNKVNPCGQQLKRTRSPKKKKNRHPRNRTT